MRAAIAHKKFKKLDYIECRVVSIYENYVPEICCSQFGCGKILTREEKLFGNRCVNHQKEPSKVFR